MYHVTHTNVNSFVNMHLIFSKSLTMMIANSYVLFLPVATWKWTCGVDTFGFSDCTTPFVPSFRTSTLISFWFPHSPRPVLIIRKVVVFYGPSMKAQQGPVVPSLQNTDSWEENWNLFFSRFASPTGLTITSSHQNVPDSNCLNSLHPASCFLLWTVLPYCSRILRLATKDSNTS